MNNEKLVQVKGSTWYIDGEISIPVYFLNEKDVILLDSGFIYMNDSLLRKVLQENGLNVKAAIASHSHVDHIGEFKWLKETYGTELIMQDLEASLACDVDLLSYLYRPAYTSLLKTELEHVFIKADRIFSKEDKEIEVCGARFKLIPAPGHSIGHTIIVTPDDVCYLADAILSEKMLQQSKVLTAMNWQDDYESRHMLLSLNYSKYILGHNGVYDSIVDLVEKNDEKREAIANLVLDVLKTKDEWNVSEIEEAVYKTLNMHTNKAHLVSVFRRNLGCLLEFLIISGRVNCAFKEGTLAYFVV